MYEKYLSITKPNTKNGIGFAILLFTITVAYGIFQARILIRGPELVLLSPAPNETITSTLMEVKGKTKNVTDIKINGQTITMNTNGDFSERLITPNGYGIILVEVKNRFGQRTKKQIKIIGNPNPNNS